MYHYIFFTVFLTLSYELPFNICAYSVLNHSRSCSPPQSQPTDISVVSILGPIFMRVVDILFTLLSPSHCSTCLAASFFPFLPSSQINSIGPLYATSTLLSFSLLYGIPFCLGVRGHY
jgi:hypothetical protein